MYFYEANKLTFCNLLLLHFPCVAKTQKRQANVESKLWKNQQFPKKLCHVGPSVGPSITRFIEFAKSLISDLYDGYKVERRHMHAHTHTDTHTHKHAAHSGLKLHEIDAFNS